MHTRSSVQEPTSPYLEPECFIHRNKKNKKKRNPFIPLKDRVTKVKYPPFENLFEAEVVYNPFLDLPFPMADDQPMWGNNRAVSPTPGAAIVAVDLGENFTVKGHHLLMIKDRQFDGLARIDLHKNIAEFIEICGMFRYTNTNVDAIKLKLFPSSLAEDPKKKKPTMPTEDIKEADIEETTTVEILEFGVTVNHETITEISNLGDKAEKEVEPSSSKPTKSDPPLLKAYKPKIPYPQRLRKEKMEERYAKFIDLIKKVRINVPLVDVLIGMPNYGKFLKDLVSNKSKMEQIFAAFLNEECSLIVRNKLPPKLGDPGSFLIPCTLANSVEYLALADLGASINLMPYSLKTFLHTVVVIIRVKNKELNLGVGDDRITFLIDKAMRHSHSNDHTCFRMDVIDKVTEEELDALLDDSEPFLNTSEKINETSLDKEFEEFIAVDTSIQDPPTDLEMKPLPKYLEYAFLEKDSLLSVVISALLKNDEKKRLVSVLKKHNEAFAWKASNISGKDHIQCPYGTYAYNHMPFGLCNAPATFQRCTIAIFQDMLETFMEVFMDDYSVFGDSFDSCLANLEQILIRCKQSHLVLNWEKCHYMVTEGIVLGHKVSSAGLEVDKAKINVIAKLAPPTNVKAVRSFLGYAGFYHRFIKDFSKISRPMTKLLEKESVFEFSEECIKAFEIDFTVGAVLGQREVKHFRPINFASKTLNNAQENYTVNEKELLVVVFAFDKFQSYLVLSKTVLFTDHYALKYLFAKQDAKPQELRDEDIDDNFPDETLMNVSSNNEDEIPWFADFANYLVGKILKKGLRDVFTVLKPEKFLMNVIMALLGDTMVLPPQQGKFLMLVSIGQQFSRKLILSFKIVMLANVLLYDKHKGSFIVNGHHVKLYHDEEQLNELLSEEIYLMCEEGKMKAIPFMAPFPVDYRKTIPWVVEKPFIYSVVENTCNKAKLYDLDETGKGIVKGNFLYVKTDPGKEFPLEEN
ncbi:reverse transcriptase domain-containing protein [Tanacetum coccineum]